MNRKPQKCLTGEYQRDLDTLRRGNDDAAEHIATSQEAIKDSLALLRRSDRMKAAQKPETRRHFEGPCPDRAVKARTKRSGA